QPSRRRTRPSARWRGGTQAHRWRRSTPSSSSGSTCMASREEQEFVRRLEEQLRQLKVADYLTQTVMTISQLAWSRLSGEARDLEQARLAIEALRALVPVLKGAVTDGLSRDLQQVVANLQLAYAGAVAQAGAAPGAPSDEP